MSETPNVLAVDLDGTLIASDMLHESFWATLGRNPLAILKAIGAYSTGGRAALKAFLAERADVDVALLPYKDAVLEEVRLAKENGMHVVLATASDRRFADEIADHLQVFDEVLASDGKTNLKSQAKAEALVAKFGEGGFVYAGDSAADLPVWAASAEALVVDAKPALAEKIDAPVVRQVETLREDGSELRAGLKALRPHQWLKNLLIFIPMLLAHDLTGASFLIALTAFVAFSLVASSVYVLNDLVDLSADRAHPRKRRRPFASGALPLSAGLWLAPGLLISGVVLGALAGPLFLLVLLFYYLCTLAYSLVLKRIAVIDICMLAGLYTLRVIAGGAATMNAPSVWLLGFSIFFFLALAAVKRQAELVDMTARGDEAAPGRGYQRDDLPLITMMALASGYVSVLVAGLYLTSDSVTELYPFPSLLWGICAVLIYWVSRIVMLTHRQRMHDDPIVFAVTDKVSLFCGVSIVALVLLASEFRGF